MLNMDIESIRSYIQPSYTIEYGFHSFINCYGLAIALNISEDRICKNAFQVGHIGANYFDVPDDEMKELSFEERMFLDFKALNISHKEIDEDFNAYFYDIGDYTCFVWEILHYSDGKHFHFVRVDDEGNYYHKMGYIAPPAICDFDYLKKQNYHLVKKYQLKFIEKNEPLSFF